MSVILLTPSHLETHPSSDYNHTGTKNTHTHTRIHTDVDEGGRKNLRKKRNTDL